MPDTRYKMFKNFLFNELEITKEDIQEWTRESVRQEVIKLVKQEYEKFSLADVIENMILENENYFTNKRLREDISQKIAKTIVDKIQINVIN